MAIIYSYPLNSNLLATDILVGTTTAMIGGKRKNQTKSFELGELANFIATLVDATKVPYIGATGSVNLGAYNLTANSIIKAGGTNLQYLLADGSVSTGPVLTGFVPYTGATSTVDLGVNDIYARWGFLNELRLFDASYSTYGEISLQGESFFIKSSPTQVLASIEPGSLGLLGFGPGALLWEAKFTYTTLTADRIYALPNTSGTIALTSDIPVITGFVPYTGATQAVNLGAFNLTVNGISVGKGAGSGTANVAVGNLTLQLNTTGTNNVAIGQSALSSSTSGNGNVAIGYNALTTSSSSTNNTAIGLSAGEFTTTGYHNVFLGWYAGRNNTTGIENTFLGYQGGYFNTTGNGNTLVGFYASRLSTTASQNASLGYQSLSVNTTGSFNSVVGYQALQYATTGQANVAIGWNAGSTHTGGGGISNNPSNSVYIGYNTASPLNNQTNQIVIGHSAIGAGSNTVTLGNTSITTTRLRGAVQGGSFVKDGGTAAQYLMADGSVTTVPYKYNFGGSVPLTGTLTTTNLLTITIPANSLSDYLDLRSLMVQQSGTTLAGFQVRVWHNSVNDFNTATRIANYSFGAGGADLFAQMSRKFSIQGGTLFGFPSTPSSATGEGSNSNAALSIAFNTTVINYLFVSVQLNDITDTATLRNVNITN